MTYQVLARKWRPRDFASLVGQEHVVRALTHALDQKRLHHAYLFTGTRGVGKTTLSRILAKALNCETGITSNPCGQCKACREIDEGRFIDYVEMDAASNRGVDEMAALLERAIYAPVDARFKVYMIDEVHMLTNHAFNAMLKTLEEPPAHVKFILATTDPQKIPVTVLSRCLQFNLKQMPATHIVSHLEHVLADEQIAFEVQALRLLARAADGSMRDALSLTDQAIAYAAGVVSEEAIRGMLGALDQSYLIRLLDAIAQADGAAVLAIADEMAARSLSFSVALQDLSSLLHRVAWAQYAPASVLDEWPEAADIRRFAETLAPRDIQLYYQIATIGRSELGVAPDEYAGFTMTLLRMLAFQPAGAGDLPPAAPISGGGATRLPQAKTPVARPAPAAVQGLGQAAAQPVKPLASPALDQQINQPVGRLATQPAIQPITPTAPAPEVLPIEPVLVGAAAFVPVAVAAEVEDAFAPIVPLPDAPATVAVAEPLTAAEPVVVGAAAVVPAATAEVEDAFAPVVPLADVPVTGIASLPVIETEAEPAVVSAAVMPVVAEVEDAFAPLPDAAIALAAASAAVQPAVPPTAFEPSHELLARAPAESVQELAPAAPAEAHNPARAALDALRSAGLRISPERKRAEAAALQRPRPAAAAPPMLKTYGPRAVKAEPAGVTPASLETAPSNGVRTPGAPAADSSVPPWEDMPPDDFYPLPTGSGYDSGASFDAAASADFTADFADGYSGSRAPGAAPSPARGDGSRGGSSAKWVAPSAPPVVEVPPQIDLAPLGFAGDWPKLAALLPLKGMAQQLACQSELVDLQGDTLKLRAPSPLTDAAQVAKLKAALVEHLGRAVSLNVEAGVVRWSAAAVATAERARMQWDAEQAIAKDSFVQALVRDFDAKIIAGSIRPIQ